MSLFKKIGAGLKKATKAVGKGIGNAAKFTAKNPLKVLAPLAGIAGVIATGGALAPGLIGKLAASKVGKTVFGKMIGKVMKGGTIVRSEIASTLKKQGKKATKAEIDAVEQGLQEEVKAKLGYTVPVDRTSSNAEEALAKLKSLSGLLSSKNIDEGISTTIDAERQVLIENPNTNGILNLSDLDEETLAAMKNAGTVKQNLLGSAVSGIGGLLGLSDTQTKKAQDALGILTGESNDPYLYEDMEVGTKVIEAKLNESSFMPMNLIKNPYVIGAGIIGGLYLIFKPKNKRRK